MSVMSSVMKIDLDDRKGVYLVCSYNSTKQLNIILLDQINCKAFSGCATDMDLRSQAATIRMIFTDFISLSLKALTQKISDGEQFLYCLDQNCEGFIFRWKSVDKEETVISIGNIKVTESDYRTISNDTFSMLAEEFSTLKEEISNMKQNLANLNEEMENTSKLLTNMSDMKEQLEKELYSKFVLVLNEKKQKIRDLKRRTNDASPSYGDRKKAKIVKPKKVHQISDSSDEYLSDPGNVDIAGPSTSKRNNSLMFFDDEEPPVLVSPSKKRNRNKNTVVNASVFQETKSNTKSHVAIESEDEDELFKYL